MKALNGKRKSTDSTQKDKTQDFSQDASIKPLSVEKISNNTQTSAKQRSKHRQQKVREHKIKKSPLQDLGVSVISWDNEKENIPELYLKIEDEEAEYRPMFKQFETFPRLNYSGTESPFETGITLTKKNENNQGRKKATGGGALRGGYCESCDHWYNCTLREHINSEKHREFITKTENFQALQNLTQELPNIDAFVKTYGLSCEFHSEKKVHNNVDIDQRCDYEIVKSNSVKEDIINADKSMLDHNQSEVSIEKKNSEKNESVQQSLRVQDNHLNNSRLTLSALSLKENIAGTSQPAVDIRLNEEATKEQTNVEMESEHSVIKHSVSSRMSFLDVLDSVLNDDSDSENESQLANEEVQMINEGYPGINSDCNSNTMQTEKLGNVLHFTEQSQFQTLSTTSVYGSQATGTNDTKTIQFGLNSANEQQPLFSLANEQQPLFNNGRNSCGFSSAASFGDMGVEKIVSYLDSQTSGRENSTCSSSQRRPSSRRSVTSDGRKSKQSNRGSLRNCSDSVEMRRDSFGVETECSFAQSDVRYRGSSVERPPSSLAQTPNETVLWSTNTVASICDSQSMILRRQNSSATCMSSQLETNSYKPSDMNTGAMIQNDLVQTEQESVILRTCDNTNKLYSVSNPDYSNITEESNQGPPSLNMLEPTPPSQAESLHEFKIFGKDLCDQNQNLKASKTFCTPGKDVMAPLKAKLEEAVVNTGSTIRNWLVNADDERSVKSLNTPVNKGRGNNVTTNFDASSDNSKVASWIQNQVFDPVLAGNSEVSLQGFEDVTRVSETNTVALSQKSAENQHVVTGMPAAYALQVDVDNLVHRSCSVNENSEGGWSDSRTSITDCSFDNLKGSNFDTKLDVDVDKIFAEDYENALCPLIPCVTDIDNVSVKSGLSSTVTEKGIKIKGLKSLNTPSRPESRQSCTSFVSSMDFLDSPGQLHNLASNPADSCKQLEDPFNTNSLNTQTNSALPIEEPSKSKTIKQQRTTKKQTVKKKKTTATKNVANVRAQEQTHVFNSSSDNMHKTDQFKPVHYAQPYYGLPVFSAQQNVMQGHQGAPGSMQNLNILASPSHMNQSFMNILMSPGHQYSSLPYHKHAVSATPAHLNARQALQSATNPSLGAAQFLQSSTQSSENATQAPNGPLPIAIQASPYAFSTIRLDDIAETCQNAQDSAGLFNYQTQSPTTKSSVKSQPKAKPKQRVLKPKQSKTVTKTSPSQISLQQQQARKPTDQMSQGMPIPNRTKGPVISNTPYGYSNNYNAQPMLSNQCLTNSVYTMQPVPVGVNSLLVKGQNACVVLPSTSCGLTLSNQQRVVQNGMYAQPHVTGVANFPNQISVPSTSCKTSQFPINSQCFTYGQQNSANYSVSHAQAQTSLNNQCFSTHAANNGNNIISNSVSAAGAYLSYSQPQMLHLMPRIAPTVAYNAVQTGAMKLTFRKVDLQQPSSLLQHPLQPPVGGQNQSHQSYLSQQNQSHLTQQNQLCLTQQNLSHVTQSNQSHLTQQNLSHVIQSNQSHLTQQNQSHLTQQNQSHLTQYWNVKKAGEFRLVFRADGGCKRQADEETPPRHQTPDLGQMQGPDGTGQQTSGPAAKRRRCLVY